MFHICERLNRKVQPLRSTMSYLKLLFTLLIVTAVWETIVSAPAPQFDDNDGFAEEYGGITYSQASGSTGNQVNNGRGGGGYSDGQGYYEGYGGGEKGGGGGKSQQYKQEYQRDCDCKKGECSCQKEEPKKQYNYKQEQPKKQCDCKQEEPKKQYNYKQEQPKKKCDCYQEEPKKQYNCKQEQHKNGGGYESKDCHSNNYDKCKGGNYNGGGKGCVYSYKPPPPPPPPPCHYGGYRKGCYW